MKLKLIASIVVASSMTVLGLEYTVVGGGPRTNRIDVSVQDFLPSTARNEYWYEPDYSASAGKVYRVDTTTTNELISNTHHTNSASYTILLDVRRGDEQPHVNALSGGPYLSTLSGNVLTYGWDTGTIAVATTSGGIVKEQYFQVPEQTTMHYAFASGSLYSNLTQSAEDLSDATGEWSIFNSQTLIDSELGVSMTWNQPSSAWLGARTEYTNLASVTSTRTMIRNPDSVLGDIDISGLSVWNSTGKNRRAGTLVTSKHVICAQHFSPSIGASIVFIGMDGVAHTNSVSSSVTISGDLQLLRLSVEVPDNIVPWNIYSADWTNRVSTIEGSYAYSVQRIPRCFFIDQMKVVQRTKFTDYGSLISAYRIDDAEWNEVGVEEDSGSPVFCIYNGEPALLFCFTGPAVGPFPCLYVSEMDAQIAAWGDTNTISQIDVSETTQYGEL